MNIPQNFSKITNETFHIGTTKFRLETDNQESGDVWVYVDAPFGEFHPLCFDIDWQKETYTLIKCEPGMGRDGTILATGVPLIKHLVRDMDSFINIFLKDIMSTLLNNQTI